MKLPRLVTIALIALALSAMAAESGPKPQRTALLQVEYTDGRTAEVTATTSMFRMEVDYGIVDVQFQKVRSIDFMVKGEDLVVAVELLDKSRLNGTAQTREIPVQSGPPIDLLAVREIKVKHQIDYSLIGIVFGLLALAVMEIVLGIDNIIFLAIVASRLPPEQQPKARRIGLIAALATRLGLLFALSWLLGLTKPIFTIPISTLSLDAAELSWRDLILIGGGAFLIVKSVRELHHRLEEARNDKPDQPRKPAGFLRTIVLIAIIDIVFSLDSVITAVGMVDILWVMVAAMVIAMGVMMLFAEPVSRFVEKHPTVKVLALSFLILIGVLLVAEGMGQHIEKGYVYFAMAFAVVIEFVNMRLRPKALVDAVANG